MGTTSFQSLLLSRLQSARGLPVAFHYWYTPDQLQKFGAILSHYPIMVWGLTHPCMGQRLGGVQTSLSWLLSIGCTSLGFPNRSVYEFDRAMGTTLSSSNACAARNSFNPSTSRTEGKKSKLTLVLSIDSGSFKTEKERARVHVCNRFSIAKLREKGGTVPPKRVSPM